MTLREITGGIRVDDAVTKWDADCAIFDCDGVLIDVSESYYSAITETVRYVLPELLGISGAIPVDAGIIQQIKAEGGYNDEVDLTYGIILCLGAAKRLGRNQKEFLLESIRGNIEQTQEHLEGLADISGITKALDYPKEGRNSILNEVFNQIFYGPQLYQELHSKESRFSGRGKIDEDRLLVDSDMLERLGARLAMVTGRSYGSARHSLGSMLEMFDMNASAFLEDMPRNLAKPNPRSLLDAISSLNSEQAVYVGDSIEDLMMARYARAAGARVLFCGITGTSADPQKKLELFAANGADAILDSAMQLGVILGAHRDL